ncbi:hypothetical protein B0T18DRAFT_442281 [Schizothecium vesticola]|uniref:non-specific serine/threonine protein kinase n=1 Tax=Schizothecium vesticola TaxID=314040 RepID=A0AA40KC42_9PEZI|nr:hypothetical protein B0T18DRAFT_442281 [Schizothecium vesticola]
MYSRFSRIYGGVAGGDERLKVLRELGDDVYRSDFSGAVWVDGQTNRTIDVLYVRGTPPPPPRPPRVYEEGASLADCSDDEREREDAELDTIAGLLCAVADNLPTGTRALILDNHAKILWTSTDSKWDDVIWNPQEHYKPSVHEYQLVRPLPTLLRSQLTVVGRLGPLVDKATYPISPWGDKKTVVSKYSTPSPWSEIQQLLGVLDELHLVYGIHHHDISGRNMLIDPDTDKLLLIDFEMAGVHDPMWPFYHSDDVNAAVAFLYQIITKDEKYDVVLPDAEADELVRARDKWVKHPDVLLDHDVAIFYDELAAWLKKRRGLPRLTPEKPAPRQIPMLSLPDSHLKDEVPTDWGGLRNLCEDEHWARRRFGRPTLNWYRPSQSQVDPTRRLLATGRYADEEDAVSGSRATPIAVPDPKRGFPQPPVPAPDDAGKVLNGFGSYNNVAADADAAAAADPTPTSGNRKRKRCSVSPGEAELEAKDSSQH